MKKFTLLFFILMLAACSSDSSNPEDGLPAATQTGANTFGCLIDGQLFIPRTGSTDIINPLRGGQITIGFPQYLFDYYELDIVDFKASRTKSMLFHIHNTPIIETDTFIINQSNGNKGIDGYEHHYITCVLYDMTTNSYQKYVSFENSGTFTITRLSSNPPNGTIISGTFNCKLRKLTDPTDEIEITNGRFDVNSATLRDVYFP